MIYVFSNDTCVKHDDRYVFPCFICMTSIILSHLYTLIKVFGSDLVEEKAGKGG